MRPRASSAYGGDYEEVVKYLRMCYDKEKLMYRHHIREILDLSTISDDHNSFIRLRNSISGGYRK